MTRDEVLVLRHLAALRNAGTSAGDALALVASAAPSPLKERLAAVVAARGRGEKQEGGDLLSRLLARADDLDGATLGAAVHSLEAADRGRGDEEAARKGLITTSVAAAVVALALWVATRTIGSIFLDFGGALPVPTQYAPWFPLIALAVAVGAPFLVRATAVAELVARLRLLAGLARGGLAEEAAVAAAFSSSSAGDWLAALPEPARLLAQRLLQRHKIADVADAVAEALERGALLRARERQARVQMAVVAVVVGLLFLTLVALYLPIFTIAGSVN